MKLGPAVARLAQVPPVSFSAPTQNVLASLARSTSDRTSPFSPALDLLVRQSLQHYHVPGLAISVVNGNETFSRVSP